MQFEHGAAFNLDFMLAACKMNEAERKALVEVFDPKRANTASTTAVNKSSEDKPSNRAANTQVISEKSEPQTPKKRGNVSSNEDETKTPRKILFPKKRESSAPPTPKCKQNSPKTPRKRDLSLPPASSKEPQTPPRKRQVQAVESKVVKTPRKKESSSPVFSDKKAPKTPAKQQMEKVGQRIGNPLTPPKAPISKDVVLETPAKKESSSSKSPENQAQPMKTPVKKAPKTPHKTVNTPRKREASLPILIQKDTKKSRPDDHDSDGIIIVNDKSLIPCKLCPLSFRFKKEYREHLKKHKIETHAKIENTKKEIEELKMNLHPSQSKIKNLPKKRVKDFASLQPSASISKNKVESEKLIKRSPRLAAKGNTWQCGLSDELGARCKEMFNAQRALRHHMTFEHRNKRLGGN